MIVANYSAVREHLKDYFDRVITEKEALIVTRRGGKNVVIISLDEYNKLSGRYPHEE